MYRAFFIHLPQVNYKLRNHSSPKHDSIHHEVNQISVEDFPEHESRLLNPKRWVLLPYFSFSLRNSLRRKSGEQWAATDLENVVYYSKPVFLRKPLYTACCTGGRLSVEENWRSWEIADGTCPFM